MIEHNALTIDGVSTSSFSYKVIVEDRPHFSVPHSKSILQEHNGLSGAIVQTNWHRPLIDLTYQIYLVGASEDEVNRFCGLLSKEGFWLENERLKSTRYWCYRVDSFEVAMDTFGVYGLEISFICHPTRFFKGVDRQVLTSNGKLKTYGTALAYPKIAITGQSTTPATFTVGDETIHIKSFTEPLIMDNHPEHPSFKTLSGKPVTWSGDFISLNPNHPNQAIGVVIGNGILSLTFETVWGWV